MERGNAPLSETLFAILRNPLDKGPLEFDQLRPINLGLIRAETVISHAAVPIEKLCGADEHFLRVAAAQRASASEGS